MATYYWSGTGTWNNSSAANWYLGTGGTGGNAPNAPLSTDTAIFNAASGAGTCTIDSTAVAAIVNFTGYTGTLAFGTAGKITITAPNSTTVVTGDTTFTVTGTNPLIDIINSTTITIAMGAMTESNSISVNIAVGSGSRVMSGSYRNLTHSPGVTGTFAAATRTIYGNFTLSSGTSVTSTALITTLAATSGTQTITTNGVNIGFNTLINAPGATIQLGDDYSTNIVSRYIQVLAGTFATNNFNLTLGAFTSTGSTTRTINLGSSLVTIIGTGTAWTCLSGTNITMSAGTSTIFFSAVGLKSMFGGTGLTYYNIKNAGGASTLTIAGSAGSGSCFFNEWQADTLPCTYAVTAGFTQTLTNFPASGTSAGAMFCLESTVKESQFTLSKASGTWNATNIYARDCNFTGGATWNATNSVDGGNNSGATIMYTGVARYWVGGTGTWDTTSTANWSTTDGGAPGASAPGPGDYAYFPSGTTGTITLGANITVSKWEVIGTPTFTFDFGTYKISCDWLGECFKTAVNMTVAGTPRVDFTYAGAWSIGPDTMRRGTSSGTLLEANTISLYITAGTVTTGTPAQLMGLDCTGFTGALESQVFRTFYGKVILHSGMDPGSGTASTTFAATSGIQEIYCGGASFNCPITFNSVGGAGTFRLMDAFTLAASRTWTFIAGTFDTNNYNFTCGSTSIGTGTVSTLGSSTITVTGAQWNINTGATINAGTSTIALAGTGATTNFVGAGLTYHNLTFVGTSATINIMSGGTFNDVSDLNPPRTLVVTAGVTLTVANFSLSGILPDLVTLQSATAGTPFTLSKASGTINASYLSLKDCTATGGATWNATYSVNVSGNTGWTITNTATTYYWVGGTGTWDNTSTANWSLTSGGAGGAGYPLIADIVIFNSASGGGTCTIGAAVNCRTLTLTGYTGTMAFGTNKISIGGANGTVFAGDTTYSVTGTPKLEFTYSGRIGGRTLSSSASITEANAMNVYIMGGKDTVGPTAGHRWGTLDLTGFSGIISNFTLYLYGSLIISPTLVSFGGNQAITLAGSASHVINCAGYASFNRPVIINGTGTYTLQNDFNNLQGLTLTAGTLDANGYSVSISGFGSSGAVTRTLLMGSGTWTITGAGTAWTTATTTNLTFNPGTSTILLSSDTAKTLIGGNLTFYNVSQGGAGALTVTGSNGFNDIQNAYSATGATSILFTAGTTQTVANFTAVGAAGKILTISSVTPGSSAYVSAPSGVVVNPDYLTITDVSAMGGAKWDTYGNTGNINGGNSPGWLWYQSNVDDADFIGFF